MCSDQRDRASTTMTWVTTPAGLAAGAMTVFDEHRAKKAEKAYQESLTQWEAQRDGYAELLRLAQSFNGSATADLVAELASLRPRPGAVVGYHTRIALRELGRRAEFLDGQIVCLDALIVPLVTGHAPGLMALHGVGSDTAALLLVAAGDHPERLRSEAAWAHLCAAAPIPASSGKTIRHRLNPAGDRQASHALWRIVLTPMNSHPPTRAYVERRTAEGLSKKEIMRCLKRYVAREVCRGRIYLANFELLGHLPSPVSPKAVRASNESARPLDVEGRAGRAGDQSVGDQKTHVGEKALAH